jgi:alpha-tubulin suppressor-like RCC1 family protein
VSGGDTYTMIAAGDAHSCGIVSGGGVKCWGSGSNGRLGNGSTANKLVPTTVTGLPGAASWISAGDAHSCAVVTNGANHEVWCWGAGSSGRLGNGGTSDATAPVKATGITTARTVSAGAQHTCATTTTGTVYCWGNNGSGRLGDGSTSNSNVPVLVQNSSGGATLAVSTTAIVAAGDDFTCVAGVGASNQVACWGSNTNSTLGDGGSSSSTRAKIIPTSSNATWVAAGDDHACAIMSGLGYCWGTNLDGRLGDGTTASSSTPRLVGVLECN